MHIHVFTKDTEIGSITAVSYTQFVPLMHKYSCKEQVNQ